MKAETKDSLQTLALLVIPVTVLVVLLIFHCIFLLNTPYNPLATCMSFCAQTGGELVFIEGPDPLVCSCDIAGMIDVE